MVHVIKREMIADGLLVDGRRFDLVETTTDHDLPGSGKTAFVVDVYAGSDAGAMTVGFKTERQARRFLTQYGDMEFDVFDNNGDSGSVIRAGLGVPTGMIRKRRETTMDVKPKPVLALPERDAEPANRGRNMPSGPGAADTASAGQT